MIASIACSRCGTPNRAGARFCSRCAAPLTAMPIAPARATPAISPSPRMQLPSAVSQAGAALGRGFRALARLVGKLVTLGGRAAYTDLIAPQPVATGMIVSPVERRAALAPFDLGCFGWLASWIVIGLMVWLLAPNTLGVDFMFMMLFFILLLLSWAGLRRPYFSRILPRAAKDQLRFALKTPQGQMAVEMIGAIKNLTPDTLPRQGHLVQLWGIPAGSTLRAWKLQFLNTDNSPSTLTLSAERLFPLVAALFAPTIAWVVIWIIFLLTRTKP